MLPTAVFEKFKDLFFVFDLVRFLSLDLDLLSTDYISIDLPLLADSLNIGLILWS